MSRVLVIHIGAQKCASSSLQASLRLLRDAVGDVLDFCFLNPAQLRAADLGLSKKKEDAFSYIDRILAAQRSDQVVVSHEMLGNRPALVAAIAERALDRFGFDRVVISGYTRLQSSYHVSAFAQWHFRDSKMLRADCKALREVGVSWRCFSALERSLLVMSMAGQDRSWLSNYRRLLAGVKHLGASVDVVSSHIPTRERPFSLLPHFLQSTGLHVVIDDLKSFDVRKNLSFHPTLIHGLSSHMSALRPAQQTCFPGPHEGNRWLFRVCKRLSETCGDLADSETIFPLDLQNRLLGHLDCRSFSGNNDYCKLMNVDSAYFKPADGATILTSEQIVDLAAESAKSRNLKEIERFNRLSENACMDAARAEIVST